MKSESNGRVVAPLPTACLFSCCSCCCLFLNCLSVAVNELAIKMTAFEGTHLHERFLVCCVTVSARESFHKAWLEHVNYLDNPSKISSQSLILLNSLLAFKSKIPFTSLPFSQRFPTISPHNSPDGLRRCSTQERKPSHGNHIFSDKCSNARFRRLLLLPMKTKKIAPLDR